MKTKTLPKLWAMSKPEQARAWKGIHAHKREERDKYGEYSLGLGEEVRSEYSTCYAEAADLSELRDEAASYARLRRLGYGAKSAKIQARFLKQSALLAERGVLRLLFVHDDTAWNSEDLFGDCLRPSEIEALWRVVEETGVFGVVSEVRDEAGEWTHADSVWGFFGEESGTLFGNAYVSDALAEAVNRCAEQYAEAVREFWSNGEEQC